MPENKRKILIIDDDHFLLDMYALKFSQNNFEVHTADSGIDALEKMQNNLDPDVVLLDIIMPKMTGFEMLETMNAKNICPNSVKIILSNKNEQEDIDIGKKLGVSDYIVKANSTPAEVINQVISVLSRVTPAPPQ